MKINIFISYYSKNDNKMKALKRAISKRQILNPIVVADSRSPKKPLAQKVKEGINNSDYIVPVLTKASINNQWVNQEIGYAEALGTKIKIFPIVEASILDNLKGFIHKNLELPYQFTSSKNKIKEANDFRRCCKLLLNDIVDFEDIKEEEKSEEVKEHLEKINATKYQPIDIKVNKELTEKTMFNLRVKLFSTEQIFVGYYLFETDKKESKWIGYTNRSGSNYIVHDEYTKVIQSNEEKFYSVNDNIYKTIQERFPHLEGRPINIKLVRFRGDKEINEVIRFYYTFSETA